MGIFCIDVKKVTLPLSFIQNKQQRVEQFMVEVYIYFIYYICVVMYLIVSNKIINDQNNITIQNLR